MPTRLHVRFTLMALLGVCSLPPTLASAQSVQVRSTQLELGLSGALPLASSRYDRSVGLGGGLSARFALTRGRFVFDSGLEAGFLMVNETWYQGDATWIDDAFIVRLRAMLGVRYAFVSSEHAQLYGRVGAGLESRIGRYDERHMDEPDQPRQRDLSWAPVIEPSIGLRLGGAHRFALIQVGLPIALHRQEPIRAHGSDGKTLAMDLSASIFVGWTL
jgi:hypothetical protein